MPITRLGSLHLQEMSQNQGYLQSLWNVNPTSNPPSHDPGFEIASSENEFYN